MFEHCATTMLAAAKLLQAETDAITTACSAAATTTAQGLDVQDISSSARCGASSSHGISSGRIGGSSAAEQARKGGSSNSPADSAHLQRVCGLLLEVACSLPPLQEANTGEWHNRVAATTELLLSAARFLEVATAKEGPAALQHPRLPQAVAFAVSQVMRCLQQCSGRVQLLQSENVGSAVDLAVLLVHAQSLLPAQQKPTTGSSRGNSTSGAASTPGGGDLLGHLGQAFLDPGAYGMQQSMWRALGRLHSSLSLGSSRVGCMNPCCTPWAST
jgi:hypothetical protein